MSKVGSRILRSIENARAALSGESDGQVVIHVPDAVDVKAVRAKSGLSQEAFALRYGFTPGAVRDWEQNRRRPEQAARVLLLVIDRDPEAVDRALGSLRTDKRHASAKIREMECA